MQGDIEVSELCRREGINPTQYYGWRKQLLGSAAKVFSSDQGRPDAREQATGEAHLLVEPAVSLRLASA